MKRQTIAASLSLFGLAGTLTFGGGCGNQSTSGQTGSAVNGGIGVQSILFIKRQTTVYNPDKTVTIDVAGGNGQVLDYQRYEPGGSLNLLSPATADGTVTNLTGSFTTADFNGADVSFDATQAVFSMKTDNSDHYHIYTVQLTPGSDGTYVVHQKTAGNYDDINPIYVPGGLISFVTNEMYTAMGTRSDEYEHAREALQLATITVDGGDANRHLFAQNLSHTVAPFLRYDGRIGFSQWEHFAATNDVKLRVVNPDGTQQVGVAGQHANSLGQDKPGDALFTVREQSPNVMVGIVTARDRTIHAGALIQIDSRNHNDVVCMDPANYASGATSGHQCLNEEDVRYTVLTPEVPTGSDPSPVGRYREPSLLPDGRILTSWADGPVNDINEQALTPPDFGIYVFDQRTGQNQLVYNDRATWDLNALAVVARREPPVIGNTKYVQDSTKPAVIGSVDVSQTSLNEVVSGAQFNNVPLGQALAEGTVAVRVVEGFSSEAAKGVTMFGLTMFEGAAVLGEAPVYADHSWEANVPPYLPIHLQPIDKFGLAIRNQQLWIQAMPGDSRRCVGCHESRTGQGVPANGPTTVAEQQMPLPSFTQPITDRTEYPWNLKIQPILDAKCVSCHNASTTSYYQVTRTDPVSGQITTYQVPTLDLSSTPVTVFYDRKVATWPASYVSIFYPATLSMDGDSTGKTVTTGSAAPCSSPGLNATPAGCTPLWGIPGSARASALPQKVNLHGLVSGTPDGTTAWPIATNPMHPEDQGAAYALTDTERQTIAVYPMDLGGQYWARQNTGFVPFITGDPVTPTAVH
jgi:Hydrazine synthase alpha subunit middle domain